MATLQDILVYLAVALAVGFLLKKFFFKKKKAQKACGNDDCDCH